MALQRKSLGRGLGSIISAGISKKTPLAEQSKSADKSSKVGGYGLFSEIPLDKVEPGKYQARRDFDEAEITALAESISSEGLLQPVLVRQTKEGTYELLAGERRLRACRKLGLKKIVACVQSASDASSAAKGLIENIQRSNLNPMETAKGIANLMANFHLTQDAASHRLGLSRESVANFLRLLKFSDEIQGYISKGRLSLGHAKVILGIDDPVQQAVVARRVIESGLNVRGTEELVRRLKSGAERSRRGSAVSAAAESAVVVDLRRRISAKLNAEVEIKHTPKRGKIIIEYMGNDDLSRILEIMGVKV